MTTPPIPPWLSPRPSRAEEQDQGLSSRPSAPLPRWAHRRDRAGPHTSGHPRRQASRAPTRRAESGGGSTTSAAATSSLFRGRLPGRAERAGRSLGRGGRRPADPLPSADHRRVRRCGTARADAVAGRALRDGPDVRAASGPLQPDQRPHVYSVPVRLTGRRVRAILHACEPLLYDEGVEVARHERLMTKAGSGWCWTITWRRWSAHREPCPGRPRWNKPVPQGSSPPVHDTWWAAACRAHGDRDGMESPDRGCAAGPAPAARASGRPLAAAPLAGAMTSDAAAPQARGAAQADDTSAPAPPEPSKPDWFRQPKARRSAPPSATVCPRCSPAGRCRDWLPAPSRSPISIIRDELPPERPGCATALMSASLGVGALRSARSRGRRRQARSAGRQGAPGRCPRPRGKPSQPPPLLAGGPVFASGRPAHRNPRSCPWPCSACGSCVRPRPVEPSSSAPPSPACASARGRPSSRRWGWSRTGGGGRRR